MVDQRRRIREEAVKELIGQIRIQQEEKKRYSGRQRCREVD